MDCDALIETLCIEGRSVPLNDWGLFKISGDDSLQFLQGQTTNDVKSLASGASHISSLLDLNGRVCSFFYLLKRTNDFLLLLAEELLPKTVSRLEKYIITDDVHVSTVTDDGLYLYLGPKHNLLKKICNNCFELSIFSMPALLLWTKEDIAELTRLNVEPIQPDQLRALQFFSDFPDWQKDLDETCRINDTVLENKAISYNKGCFLGQEIASKIHNNKGARYSTVILKITDKTVTNPEKFTNHTFLINDKKAGKITNFLHWEGGNYFRAQLHRNFLMYEESYTVSITETNSAVVTVMPLPLSQNLALAEFASEIYYRALKIFSKENDQDDQVITLLENSIELNPTSPDAYESLGVIHGRRKDYKKALNCMDKLLAADPDSVMAHTNKSLYLMKMGRFDEAEKEKAEAITASFRLERKKVELREDEEKKNQLKKEDHTKKQQMFLQVLDIDPDDLLANFSLGRLYNESGNYDLAEKHLKKVIEKDNKYSAAYLELGIAMNGLNRIEETKDIYRKGLPIAISKGEQMIANKIWANLARIK